MVKYNYDENLSIWDAIDTVGKTCKIKLPKEFLSGDKYELLIRRIPKQINLKEFFMKLTEPENKKDHLLNNPSCGCPKCKREKNELIEESRKEVKNNVE